jgi:triosephosphate isomerase
LLEKFQRSAYNDAKRVIFNNSPTELEATVRKKIIAGNWKMNKTPSEAVALAEELKKTLNADESDVVFCVPFVDLAPVKKVLEGSRIKLGAQNAHYEDSGAFTGEISAAMLAEIGVDYVIVGHSERRQYFNETNETVNKKAVQLIKNNLIPIICVGETLTEREQGITIERVSEQIKVAYLNISSEDARKTVVAYEPIWAIGTGKTASNEQAEEVCAAIRKSLASIFDAQTASEIRIQYGGSVNGKNAAALFAMENIDGGLVGGASLKAEFSRIVNFK